MTDSTEIEQKKNLLQQEIIDKHYDQQKFVEFCLTKKENGDDINNWSFQEMKEVVDEFLSIEKSKEVPLEPKPTITSILKSDPKEEVATKEISANISETIQDINMSKQKEEERHANVIEVQCKRLEKTVLNDKSIIVIVKNPKVAESSKFLSSGYVNYEVETPEVGWLVHRRYSEFEWLRTVLVKFHPGKVVAPLPNKKIGGRRFEEDFVKKRMSFLQRFMDEIMIDEVFKASEPLIAFLSMNDRAQFECKMKELSSYIPSNYVEDLRFFDGKVEIFDEEDETKTTNNEKYYTNIKNYFDLQNQIFERLNFNLKSAYLNFANVCENLENIEKDFEILKFLNTKVQMRETITKSFEELMLFFHDWKTILFTQNDLVKTHLKEFFKYSRMEGCAYQEIIKFREDVKARYTAENVRLTAKKEKLWSGMDVNKWEIIDEFNKLDREKLMRDRDYAMSNMCTKETVHLNHLKQQLGYANKMNSDELKKMITKNCTLFISNLKMFTNLFYPTLTDGITIWSRMTTFINMDIK